RPPGRLARLPVIALGALLLIFAIGLAGLAPGDAGATIIVGLFLNGVGWNLAFVSGSALLTDALSPVERASVQGFADLLMGLMGAIGSAAGGMILGIWGFAILNAGGAALRLRGRGHDLGDWGLRDPQRGGRRARAGPARGHASAPARGRSPGRLS